MAVRGNGENCNSCNASDSHLEGILLNLTLHPDYGHHAFTQFFLTNSFEISWLLNATVLQDHHWEIILPYLSFQSSRITRWKQRYQKNPVKYFLPLRTEIFITVTLRSCAFWDVTLWLDFTRMQGIMSQKTEIYFLSLVHSYLSI
jgi:hypothetical protein